MLFIGFPFLLNLHNKMNSRQTGFVSRSLGGSRNLGALVVDSGSDNFFKGQEVRAGESAKAV